LSLLVQQLELRPLEHRRQQRASAFAASARASAFAASFAASSAFADSKEQVLLLHQHAQRKQTPLLRPLRQQTPRPHAASPRIAAALARHDASTRGGTHAHAHALHQRKQASKEEASTPSVIKSTSHPCGVWCIARRAWRRRLTDPSARTLEALLSARSCSIHACMQHDKNNKHNSTLNKSESKVVFKRQGARGYSDGVVFGSESAGAE
jgi:hypothetical protein